MLSLETYDMTLKYKVIRKTEIDNLEVVFNSYAEDGYRVISIVWDNDESCFVVTLERIK